MKSRIPALTLAFLMGITAATGAKGPTTQITIEGSDLPQPMVIIKDPAVLEDFQVWRGPGVLHGRGPIFQGGGFAWEETEGFIVNWTSGVVAQRPSGLPRYRVSFYADSQGPVYQVYYELDSAAHRGFVYIPETGDGTNLVHDAITRGHGYDGHWLLASDAWQKAVVPLIVAARQ